MLLNNILIYKESSKVMSYSILFVDDEEYILKYLEMSMIDENYNCFFADNANDGLEIIEHTNIDIVVSDIKMPEIDGINFLRQVELMHPNIVKIILSGEADIYHLIEVINSINVFSFILKSWNIHNIIKTVLSKAIKQVELISKNEELNHQLANKLRELEIKHFRLQKVTESLEDSNAIIMTIANAVEAKDKVTNGHVNRVAYWVQKLGERLDLSQDELEFLRKGAVLHDIGKIGIPDEILNKPGALTKEEFDIMKTHTVIGERIIRSLKSFENIKSIIRHHHEKLDGSGYPDGLKGAEIDIYTRIVAIVDIYDALITDRPYRNAMSKDQAFDILKTDAQKGLLDVEIINMLEEEVERSAEQFCVLSKN